jgi:hypothetical protein
MKKKAGKRSKRSSRRDAGATKPAAPAIKIPTVRGATPRELGPTAELLRAIDTDHPAEVAGALRGLMPEAGALLRGRFAQEVIARAVALVEWLAVVVEATATPQASAKQ